MAKTKPLADFLPALLGPALARQGFSGADIIASWPEIVGERLAGFSQPLRVEWPRRRPGTGGAEPATLVLRAESAFALELQHLAPVIIERVNGFYGWRCIGRLVLKQGPVRRSRPAEPPAPLPLDETDRRRIADTVQGVESEGMKNALRRLGAAVLARPSEKASPLPASRLPDYIGRDSDRES